MQPDCRTACLFGNAVALETSSPQDQQAHLVQVRNLNTAHEMFHAPQLAPREVLEMRQFLGAVFWRCAQADKIPEPIA